MKKILALGLLASFLIALSGTGKDNEGKKATRYNADGKAAAPDATYLLEWPDKNGRIVVYRKTKRDIDALIKALKEAGVTDPNLLSAKSWTNVACSVSGGSCVKDPSCTSSCQKHFVPIGPGGDIRDKRQANPKGGGTVQAPNAPFWCTCSG